MIPCRFWLAGCGCTMVPCRLWLPSWGVTFLSCKGNPILKLYIKRSLKQCAIIISEPFGITCWHAWADRVNPVYMVFEINWNIPIQTARHWEHHDANMLSWCFFTVNIHVFHHTNKVICLFQKCGAVLRLFLLFLTPFFVFWRVQFCFPHMELKHWWSKFEARVLGFSWTTLCLYFVGNKAF